jgi:Ca-activated chloride channel family protein
VIAPRYGDEHATGGLETHESTRANLLVEYPLTIKMALSGEMAKATVQCPSHAIALTDQEGERHVTLSQGGFLDRDFVLLVKDQQGKSFASVCPDGDEFTVIASFCPSFPDQKPQPLRLKVLVDCSGSMGGDSIGAARKALHEILKELDEMDGISYSRFGDSVVHDLPGLVPEALPVSIFSPRLSKVMPSRSRYVSFTLNNVHFQYVQTNKSCLEQPLKTTVE